jgi:hypothetical protein
MLVNPAQDKADQDKRDAAAAAARRQDATDRFLRDIYPPPPPPPKYSEPQTYLGEPPPIRRFHRPEPMEFGHKLLFALAGLAALLTALAFWTLPQIHAYFSGFTGNAYIAVTAVASLIAAGATMAVICAVVSAVHWVRENWIAIAAVIVVIVGILYYFH